jgi:hypothetical protein
MTPVAMPVEEPMVAIRALLLVHIPPEAESFNIAVVPGHKPELPVIGSGLKMVTVLLAKHPPGKV